VDDTYITVLLCAGEVMLFAASQLGRIEGLGEIVGLPGYYIPSTDILERGRNVASHVRVVDILVYILSGHVPPKCCGVL
jgi:hypothetical protein